MYCTVHTQTHTHTDTHTHTYTHIQNAHDYSTGEYFVATVGVVTVFSDEALRADYGFDGHATQYHADVSTQL